MKIRFYEDYGFAGTESEWEEDIPDEIVERGQEAIDEYVDQSVQGYWENAASRISVSAEIVEE